MAECSARGRGFSSFSHARKEFASCSCASLLGASSYSRPISTQLMSCEHGSVQICAVSDSAKGLAESGERL
ncbi:uncharacterized protein BO72DRAFT_241637 [Aspergillus fijiensis CBS 313.89]|uniref:Uncharacterized protein n=1 Tax=Aspergillus fijiensis CBS 313.89 TaxID=1448319 RepID=A0A8G1S0S9_9EURO|nr:uncharacterized protein BO72DRAFT_241637 [Aspergillus fijiensis CBS 313.89]RAK81221.1 hypothetical protein BO72DRAFT_241637 [Aspergillus fijiensis CBS 313.89]